MAELERLTRQIGESLDRDELRDLWEAHEDLNPRDSSRETREEWLARYLPRLEKIRKWADWLAKPMDEKLLAEVQAIFEPVMDIGHEEGLPENN